MTPRFQMVSHQQLCCFNVIQVVRDELEKSSMVNSLPFYPSHSNHSSPAEPARRQSIHASMLPVQLAAEPEVEPTSNGEPPPPFFPLSSDILLLELDEVEELCVCKVAVEKVMRFVGVIGATVVSITATLVVVKSILAVLEGDPLDEEVLGAALISGMVPVEEDGREADVNVYGYDESELAPWPPLNTLGHI